MLLWEASLLWNAKYWIKNQDIWNIELGGSATLKQNSQSECFILE